MAIPFTMINLDKPRKLRMGMGAMVEFEQLTGIKITEIESEISMDVCAKLLWVMLKQDEPELTLEGTWKLVDDNADNLNDITLAVGAAITAAFQQSGKLPPTAPIKPIKG